MNGNAYLNYTQDYINQIAYIDQNILVMTYINGDQYLNTGVEHNIRWTSRRLREELKAEHEALSAGGNAPVHGREKG